MIASKEKMDALLNSGCGVEGCQSCGQIQSEIFIHSKCHPNMGLNVQYFRGRKIIISCKQCDKKVVQFKIK